MKYATSDRYISISFYNCNNKIINDTRLFKIYAMEFAKSINLSPIKYTYSLPNDSGINVHLFLENCYLSFLFENKINLLKINIFSLTEINMQLTTAISYLKNAIQSSKCEINELYDNKPINENIHALIPVKEDLTRLETFPPSFNSPIITILGSAGGVAKGILSILNVAISDLNDPIHSYIINCKLYLIDKCQKNLQYYKKHFPNLINKISIIELDLKDNKKFIDHLKKTNTQVVIDISFADTVDMLRCCNSLNVIYINSAFESTAVDENESFAGFSLQERYKIFESHRNEFKNTLGIICSGMNPGVVQWMAIELMKKYPNEMPKGCYIVEDDTTFFKDKSLAKEDTIYTSWYPEGFLDEAIYSYPNFIKNHHSLFLYKEVYELEFKVTLGNKVFYGCLMPHEEALTLGKMYPMETGFIYKINEHTTNLIRKNLSNLDKLWSKEMVVLDPEKTPLIGEDLVGILLTFNNKEAFMYNSLKNEVAFKKYNINATYLQVASGIYGALCSVLLDKIPKGIYYVDELLTTTNSKYGEYLSYHLKEFVYGENNKSDGSLLNRLREIKF